MAWVSPITSELLVAKTIRLAAPVLVAGQLFWLEGRPSEQGRQVICRCTPGQQPVDVTPSGEWNVRTRVHEYGGGDFLVHHTKQDTFVVFSNNADQRLYRQSLAADAGDPVALTPDGARLRFADAVVDEPRARLICIMEDHSVQGAEPVNTIVAVSLHAAAQAVPAVLVSGADFYAAPCVSPDGTQIAWVQWSHPDMPWDATCVMVAPLTDTVGVARAATGGNGGESCGQPRWAADGELYLVSDRSGWWNIHRDAADALEEVCKVAAECAGPDWQLGQRSYAAIPNAPGVLLCAMNDPAKSNADLVAVHAPSGRRVTLTHSFTSLSALSVGEVDGRLALALLAGSASQPSTVAYATLPDLLALLTDSAVLGAAVPSHSLSWVQVKSASTVAVDPGYLSMPQPIEFPSKDGRTAHMLYYPPKNKDHVSELGKAPPLLCKSHGGPTAAISASFNLSIQYWTSRGWAVADVNYGGSSGYGRAFRDRLKGNWGVVDVEDVSAAASHLVAAGCADAERLCIDGGSAGGYTTLACLAFTNVFKAGASLYGIGDLCVLARDTHKFESRYMDSLVGRWPEDEALYKARSPINSVDKLDCPVALFQGLEDKVVPPNQAQAMYDALRTKGIPTALCMFEGEQHGFRQAKNIRRCIDAEHFFFCRVFGLPATMPADVAPIEIVNLPRPHRAVHV